MLLEELAVAGFRNPLDVDKIKHISKHSVRTVHCQILLNLLFLSAWEFVWKMPVFNQKR